MTLTDAMCCLGIFGMLSLALLRAEQDSIGTGAYEWGVCMDGVYDGGARCCRYELHAKTFRGLKAHTEKFLFMICIYLSIIVYGLQSCLATNRILAKHQDNRKAGFKLLSRFAHVTVA